MFTIHGALELKREDEESFFFFFNASDPEFPEPRLTDVGRLSLSVHSILAAAPFESWFVQFYTCCVSHSSHKLYVRHTLS